MLRNKPTLISTYYLYFCDNINKYNLKTVHKVFKVTKIKLMFNTFKKSFFFKEYQETDFFIRLYFCICILTLMFPKISFNFFKTKIKNNFEDNSIVKFSIELKNSSYIDSFLLQFFIEFKGKNIFFLEKFLKTYVYSLKFPISYFKELEMLLKLEDFHFISKESLIKLNFNIKKKEVGSFQYLPFFL